MLNNIYILEEFTTQNASMGKRKVLIQNRTAPLMYILGLHDGFNNSAYYKPVLLETGLIESQIYLLDKVLYLPHLDNPKLYCKA